MNINNLTFKEVKSTVNSYQLLVISYQLVKNHWELIKTNPLVFSEVESMVLVAFQSSSAFTQTGGYFLTVNSEQWTVISYWEIIEN